MNRVLVTTVRRLAPIHEHSGWIYVVDPLRGRVLRRSSMIEPPYREVDQNPRGGLRGSRGLSIRPDQAAIANALAVFRYDPDWNFLGMLTHPSCSAIHDILYDGDTLWVTSAGTDLLLQFNLSGSVLHHYYLREQSPASLAMGWAPPILMTEEQILKGFIDYRNPLTHEEETFDWAHVNSLCKKRNGDILVSLGQVIDARFASLLKLKVRLIKLGLWPAMMAMNRWVRDLLRLRKDLHSDLVVRPAKSRSAILRLNHNDGHRLCLEVNDITTPSHSLLVLPDDTIIYLNTTTGSVLHIEPDEGKVLSNTKVTDGFLRGAALISPETLLVGSQNELILFSLKELRIGPRLYVSEDPNESVYDIKVLPDHYSLPPLSFGEHFEKSTGYQARAFIQKDHY